MAEKFLTIKKFARQDYSSANIREPIIYKKLIIANKKSNNKLDIIYKKSWKNTQTWTNNN